MADQYSGTLDERPSQEDRSIRELLSDLWENTQKLVRQEIELANTELDSKIQAAKADLMKVALGSGALYAGVLALVAALVLFVAKFVAPWVAALLVGVVVLGLGFALLRSGKEVSARKLKPERTMGSMREDVRTFKEAVRCLPRRRRRRTCGAWKRLPRRRESRSARICAASATS